jgi:hypothetical protein
MAWTTPGTATAGEVLTAAFWNTNVRDNSLELAPLALAWTAFSPTLAQNGTRTTTSTSRYLQVGKMVIVQVLLTITQAGSAGSGITLSGLPTAREQNCLTGHSWLYSDTGTGRYVGITLGNSTSAIEFAVANSGAVAFLGVNPNIATANTDALFVNLAYETA